MGNLTEARTVNIHQEGTKKVRFRGLWVLKSAVTVALVFLILQKVGISRIAEVWQDIKQFEIVMAAIISPIVILLGTQKWKLIVRGSGIVVSWKSALVSFLGGMGIGLLTPMRVGELSRIFFIHGKKEVLLGIALLDKAIDLQSLLVLATIGCAFAFGIIPTAVFGFFAVLVLVMILYPASYTSLVRRITRYFPFKKKLEVMIGSLEKLPTKLLVSCMAIRLITSGVDMVQLGLLIHAFHPIGFIAVLATYPLILLINTFPITISGIGLREGAAAFLLSFFGIPASAAVMASFLLFCINTLLPGIVGAFLASQCVKRNVRG